MFKKKKNETVSKKIEEKALCGLVSNPSYNLVPESHYYGDSMSFGRENIYNSFLNKVSPSEINTYSFNKTNLNEASLFQSKAERDFRIAEVTGSRILRMQDSDVYELERSIEWEIILRNYLTSKMSNNMEVLNEK